MLLDFHWWTGCSSAWRGSYPMVLTLMGAFCVLLWQLILCHGPDGQLTLLSSYYEWNVTVYPATPCCDSACRCFCTDWRVSVFSMVLIFKKAKWQWGPWASIVIVYAAPSCYTRSANYCSSPSIRVHWHLMSLPWAPGQCVCYTHLHWQLFTVCGLLAVQNLKTFKLWTWIFVHLSWVISSSQYSPTYCTFFWLCGPDRHQYISCISSVNNQYVLQ